MPNGDLGQGSLFWSSYSKIIHDSTNPQNGLADLGGNYVDEIQMKNT